MANPELRKKVIRGEIDINAQENFFSKLVKGLMVDLTGSIKVRGKSVPHIIVNTGDDIMYLERKGQDMSVEPKEVSNENYIYNYIPRGVLTPAGVNLLSDQLTSPYTRGTLQVEYEGSLHEMTAEFRRMPLTMSVGIKYYLDSFTDALEILQYIITHINFIRTYQIIYMGQSIMCSYKFPEDLENEFNAEFDGLSQDSKFKTIDVQIEVETNIPVYYPRTAIESDLTVSGQTMWKITWICDPSNPEDPYYDPDFPSGGGGGYPPGSGDDGVEKTVVIEDEDEAFEFAENVHGQMKRISKTLWNKEPIFSEGKLITIEDRMDERMTTGKPVSKYNSEKK
jgi:hypothetical protein